MHAWAKSFKRIPDNWREAYKDRTREELAGDVEIAFDRMHDQNLKIWFLTFVLTLEGAIIGWLATTVVQCISK